MQSVSLLVIQSVKIKETIMGWTYVKNGKNEQCVYNFVMEACWRISA
jgi:hypothetical protein